MDLKNSSSSTSGIRKFEMHHKASSTFGALILVIACLICGGGDAATKSSRQDAHLAAYPSPNEDGTFYIVNLSYQPLPASSLRNVPSDSDLGVKFFLHTKSEENEAKEQVHEIQIGEENPGWLKYFRPNATMKILCHGYKSSHTKPFPAEMKTALLGNSVNVNVVMVGWEGMAKSDLVQAAVRNMRYVGEKTAEFLTYVYRYSAVDFKKIHFIGHNLGAHVGGIAGELLQQRSVGKLGRITGLDPAGVRDCGAENVLDPSDAEIVEAIHTDSEDHCGESWIKNEESLFRHWGFGGRVGHVDYYPAGNKSWKAADTPDPCPHCRSYKIMTELIRKNPGGDLDPICSCNGTNKGPAASECRCL